jgi:hypothetical protein
MRGTILLAMALALGATGAAAAEEREFTAGDGTRFVLPVVDGLPGRAESDRAVFEKAGFDTDTTALTLTDRFSFVFKGGERPLRLRVEDVTLAPPMLLVEAAVPGDLADAGFRRSRFELSAPPCPIARGESCSAWMFGPQEFRLYRATLIYADGSTETLLQAEPFAMAGFIARLGDRIPTRPPEAAQTAQNP